MPLGHISFTSHYGGSRLAGGIHFLCNKEALPCVRRYSWWVRHVGGGNIFFAKYRGPSGGSQLSGGGIVILRVQSTADGCRSLTTLTRPRREHHGGGRRRGLGRERRGDGEDSTMVAHAVVSTRVYWSGCRRWKITGGVGE